MKNMILAAALLATVGSIPANGHCYSIWRYPKPQHCGVVIAQAPVPFVIPGEMPVLLPPPTEEELRARAIEKLKVELQNLTEADRAEIRARRE